MSAVHYTFTLTSLATGQRLELVVTDADGAELQRLLGCEWHWQRGTAVVLVEPHIEVQRALKQLRAADERGRLHTHLAKIKAAQNEVRAADALNRLFGRTFESG